MARKLIQSRYCDAYDVLIIRNYLLKQARHVRHAIDSLEAGCKIADLPGLRRNVEYYRHIGGWIRHALATLTPRSLADKRGAMDAASK